MIDKSSEVATLIEKAAKADTALAAMQFAQAASNAASAMLTVKAAAEANA